MTRGVRKTTGVTVLIVFMLSRPLPAQTPQIDALRESAQQGNAEAQYEFGSMHDVGCLDEIHLIDSQDVEVDTIGDTEAARWYRLAAEQGHASAQSRLGDFYQFGFGVPRDHAEAVRWYRLAAEQGGAVAQFTLGNRYATGRGVPLDDIEAARWYQLAAEQGYDVAQYNLGVLYDIGRGLPQNDIQAMRWYRSAAEQGHADAQWNLGVMYEAGVGVPQDYVAAYVWFSLSAAGRQNADRNRELVIRGRDRVASTMSPDEFAEAQRLTREWNAAHPRDP